VALGLAIAGLLAVFSGGLLLITAGTASSTPTGADQTCVPSQPWTETIEHPAVSHTETVVVVDEEAWTETIPAVAELWQNFSPNNQQQKFEGPPDWPDDPRGTWQHIDKPIPPGHQGPDGVYQRGEGNGSWFYRRAAVPEHVIEHPAVTHEEQVVVIDKPAWTETVEHPAVVCPGPTEPTTEPTTEPPEVEPSTGQASEEPDEPEVLGEQETAEPASQAEVPTVVDAGLAGPPSEERWGAPLLVGGLLLLTSSGAVAAARRRA
jgi:hypothetical protein